MKQRTSLVVRGGALIINDEQFVDRAEIIREKGTIRSLFFRGQVDKYTWADMGSSYVMSDVLTAFLYTQLEVWQSIQARRRDIWNYYDHQLRCWAEERGIGCPIVPPYREQSYHMYYLLMRSLGQRQALISFLKSCGILSVFHFLPLHRSPMVQKLGGRNAVCPVSEEKSDHLVRLPFFNALSRAEQDQVIRALLDFCE